MREKIKPAGASYYRARYYDPVSGRFISEDPAGFAAGFNFYRYLSNYPAGSRDPSGLNPDDDSGVPGPVVRAIVIPITIYGYCLCANKVKHDFKLFSRERHPRHAHCMASCNPVKQCGSKPAAFCTGCGKEFLDVLDCVRTAKTVSCNRAMQRSEIEDKPRRGRPPKDEPTGSECDSRSAHVPRLAGGCENTVPQYSAGVDLLALGRG